MRAAKLIKILPTALRQNYNTLLKGTPGVGKSDIIMQVVKELGWDMIICHGVVSDPTDFKGLPVSGISNGQLSADFIPYGDLRQMMEATKPLVVLFDDVGQAPQSVQAAIMQLILAREINGKKISKEVRFIAATNNRKDQAGVSGLITPLLSRFKLITEFEVDASDWTAWAVEHNMPAELIAYINLKPNQLTDFKPTKEIENFACPRTVAALGDWINQGIHDLEVWKGAVGEGFATEFKGFWDTFVKIGHLPAQILANPKKAEIPATQALIYFVCVAIAAKASDKTGPAIMTYANRLQKENGVEMAAFLVKSAMVKSPKGIRETNEFVEWSKNNKEFVI